MWLEWITSTTPISVIFIALSTWDLWPARWVPRATMCMCCVFPKNHQVTFQFWLTEMSPLQGPRYFSSKICIIHLYFLSKDALAGLSDNDPSSRKITLPKSDYPFRYFNINCNTYETKSHMFKFRELYRNQNALRRYASAVLRTLLSSYGLNIGHGTFYFWLTKFSVSEFDPVVQVFWTFLITFWV